ncbi:MAG: ATP-binding protein [Planctomycetota bacterium]|jgi:PAS domain S-box-containing protein
MGVVCLLSGGVAIWMPYSAAFEAQRLRLVDTVKVQARLMEAVARFDVKMRREQGHPDTKLAAQDTLSQIREAHESSEGLGKTGEFVLARREGNQIVFLLSHRHHDFDKPRPIPFDADYGEPMRRALSGRSGSIVGLDYRGELVLAAFEPVAVLNVGAVAKIDLSEIRAPFGKAGAIAGGIAALLILLGAALFLRITNPLLARLEKSEERYRSLVNATTSIVWTTDAAGRFVEPQSSFERHTGKPWIQHAGRGWIDALHPDDRDRIKAGWARVVAECKPQEIEGRVWHAASREYRHTVLRAVPILEADGSVREWVGTATDIHDRRVAKQKERELRAELEQSGRLAAIGELAAGVAHEVNNPINTIINCAQLLKEGDRDTTLHEDIIEEGQRIASIVRDLLEFAREGRPEFLPTEIGAVLRRTLSLIGESIREQGIEICQNVRDDLPLVMARPEKLQQIFLNLLINAKDALVEDKNNTEKEIRIAASTGTIKGQPAVCVSVRDNGPGIPPDRLGRIFEPFYTSKRDRGGTGLGLSITRGIADDHDANLDVKSASGQFTEFVLQIPTHTGSYDPLSLAAQ